jgi:multidrug resistance efflux pump
MALQYPKLRSDLVVSRQETSGGAAFIVKDPVTGRFFRLKEEEHYIAQQLDGATSQDVVRGRAEERFGILCSPETLEHFFRRLAHLGLIEGEGPRTNQPFDGHGRVRGNLLYLRFAAFDPDRFFDRLIKMVGFFFTPHFVVVSAGLILFAMGITILNWNEIWQDFRGLIRFQSLLLAWLTLLFIIAAHEFAHGLACKHFGGQVHEIGFMLLYFQPTFYCNVSDAWLFPDKSKRLWVSFAGAYFEFFLWASATLVWRLTDPGSLLHFQALVVTAASGIATLFNFNPLIKLDGYYMLSDYLEIPNLRQRASNYLGAQFKKLTGMVGQDISQEATRRERRIYLVYGLLAGAYSFLVLGWIALKFGGFLIGRYQGLGFVLFTGLVVTMFRHRLRNLLSKTSTLFRSGGWKFASIRRPMKALILCAVVLVLLFLGRMELTVSGEFRILPAQNADIRAEVDGIIKEIFLDEGDVVRKGDLIARLWDRDYRVELDKITAEIDEKRARLRMLKAGPRREEIELARTEVEKTREQHKYAMSNKERFDSLFKQEMVSRKQFEEAEERMAVRGTELKEAQSKLEVLSAGHRREEIEAAEAELSRLEVQQRFLEGQLALVSVASPVSGVITTRELKEKIGLHVKKGDLIAEVHELRTVKAEIVIPEKEIADVRVDQKVRLKARAYPNLSFEGKVTSIAPIATKGEQKWEPRTILVGTELENTSLLLKPEMTGNAKILCGKRRIFDLLTRRLARYIRVEFWSWW